jgi:hypothetical protein
LQAEAQKRRYSNFDINYDTDDPFAILLPYLSHWKGLGQQSATRAVAELRLKQPEAAFRDTLFCLHMSETLKDDPILISFLVSVALREISLTPVWYGLASRQWNASELEQLQAQVTKVSTKPHGELVVTLENGQVWTETQTSSGARVKAGDRVTIKPGALGSFLLVAPNGRSARVTRVR